MVNMFDWDKNKSEKNKAERGQGFEEAEKLFNGPFKQRDVDVNGEARSIIYGYLGGIEWIGVFAFERTPPRVISLRRANKRERTKHYG